MTVYHDSVGITKGYYHNVIHVEDTWELCLVHHHTPDYIRAKGDAYLHHRCSESGTFAATRDSYAGLSWPCEWCKKEIPAGIQALFVLMTGDMEV